MPRRYLSHFVNVGNTLTYTFPELGYEFEETQEIVAPHAQFLGGNYGVDLLGFGESILGPRLATIRFLVHGDSINAADAAISNMVSTLRRIGVGKLYTNNNHWAYARMVNPPSLSYVGGEHLYMPTQVTFRLISDWYSNTELQQSFTNNLATQDFTLNNSGDIPLLAMTIRFEANTTLGFVNPSITNMTNGYAIGTLRDSASINSVVRINTGTPKMEYSNDNEASWAADYANRVIGVNQSFWFRVEPGNNTIRVANAAGAPSMNLRFNYYPAFAV